MKQRPTLKKSFLRGHDFFRPGQLVPEDISEAEMKMLIASDSLETIEVAFEMPSQQQQQPQRIEPSRFDMDPAALADIEEGQLQVIMSNLGADPAGLSAEDMRAQLSSGFKGDSQEAPKTTGTKLDEAINGSEGK